MGRIYIPSNVKPSVFSDDKYINKINGISLKKSDALLEQLCTSNELIAILLSQQVNNMIEQISSLPLNYPIKQIHVDGSVIEVTNFIHFENNVATFKNGSKIILIDASKIIGISF